MPVPKLIAIAAAFLPSAHGHGMLIDPPSRNFVASDKEKCQGGKGCVTTLKTCAGYPGRKPGCLETNPTSLVGRSGRDPWSEVFNTSGLCGDPVQTRTLPEDWRQQPHLLPTPPQATYKAGQIVKFKIMVHAEHFGFYTFRICDTGLDGATLGSRAEGEACLNKWVLQRAPPDDDDTEELPIDEKNPDRWYVPYGKGKEEVVHGRGKAPVWTVRYIIPEGLSCRSCTLQWTWITGNQCAFDSDHSAYCKANGCSPIEWPKYACSAQSRSPELDWNCADIRINGDETPTPAPSPTPPSDVEARLASLESDMKLMKIMMEKLLSGGGSPPSRRRSAKPSRRRSGKRR